MKYIISRTNGKVTQIWEYNPANWEFFLGHRSRDVHWRNLGERINPMKFDTFFDATEMLQKRSKYLGPAAKKEEKNWEYKIVKENYYVELTKN